MRGGLIFLGVYWLVACSQPGGSWQHYRIAALDEAQSRGLSIVIHIDDADCSDQRAALDEAIEDRRLKNIVAFRAQASKESLLLRSKNLRACSIVVFKGEREVKRLGNLNDTEQLRDAMLKAL